ncbi:MAG: protein-methionine-sulfoxide reductase catalytic subunit MsrP [Chloroflexi bacterium]|jgi:methionine sulfoxide reductase catalytic subunit|nr:protein-methionine-sulfoxide reductase catalytic subunit MsrP [Chloroflexota bacterium]MBT3669949.1 protein-methionine-sulfoxide reductase catalytic subunit MsrP [Chloroflexota bacterium]MBT4001850.1 protein-methionine-sulfoxide reductase catalytic subunit MsrP [Chloroflexota bacterium]MBT4304851.1 protein-methionine-sulfoxide reductase catalytic subunit MsrP [Chloroflexota bacterium]MBT4534648.1 protein-methionine-sulfoxide reductase catalytic subunit MsrP [Chloroflexota bacterium]
MKIRSSEITPKTTYLSRKEFMKGAAIAGGSAFLAACGVSPQNNGGNNSASGNENAVSFPVKKDEFGTETTPFESITNFNNFYEFNTDKEAVAKDARNFVSSPWQVEVGGLVNNPMILGMGDILKFEQEERIYRLRCVEGWSMVIPWNGFSLSKILNMVEPKSEAKYVRFETLYDPEQMPGQDSKWYEWPYVEGLRIDEAMNDLATIATGLYGEEFKPQSGAPVRLVVPWKYGFKSIKSIVKIELVTEMPTSLWMAAAPREYGFFANVNPDVDHPRWSQGSERRIGELSRIETLKFNGYEEQVAALYDGMDLEANY